MASRLVKKNTQDIKDLIKRVTGIQEQDTVNLEIAFKYVGSSLTYHQFLDVLSIDVWNRADRITERFQHHSEHKKEKAWLALNSQLKVQTDLHKNEESVCSVLFVLMRLANLKAPFPKNRSLSYFFKASPEKAAEIDLEDDEVKYQPDFTYDTDTDSDSESAEKSVGPISTDSGACCSPDLVPDLVEESRPSTSGLNYPPNILPEWVEEEKRWQENQRWLKENLVTDYWSPWAAKTPFVSEQVLMTEIMWMLNGNKGVHLFQWSGNKFVLREGTRLIDLTEELLQNCLPEVMECATYHVELEDFIRSHTSTKAPRVTSAFALALGQALRTSVHKHYITLEDEVADPDSGMTLILLIYHRLPPLMAVVRHLWCLLQEAVVQTPPNVVSQAARTMHLLYTVYMYTSRVDDTFGRKHEQLPILVTILLKTMESFLTFVDQLLGGHLEDPHMEFIIERSTPDASNLDKVLVLRDVPLQYQKQFFIYRLLKEITLAASVIIMLKESHNWEKELESQESLAEEFSRSCRTTLGLVSLKKSSVEVPTPEPKAKFEHLFLGCDPLLKANFLQVFPTLNVGNETTTKPTVVEDEELPLSLPESFFRLEMILERVLCPLVLTRCHNIHQKVMEVMKGHLCIQDHLLVIQKLFLFEEATSLTDFGREIMQKVLQRKKWKCNQLVGLAFKTRTAQVLFKHSDLVSMTVNEESTPDSHPLDHFDALCLNYSAPSPINILLNTDSMKTYRNIFIFLMKMNYAKAALEALKFKELCDLEETEDEFSAEMMFLFFSRNNFLHLMNCLCRYFMTGLLGNKQAQFTKSLDRASSFHAVLSLHCNHLEKLNHFCLLSSTFLSRVILKIFNVVVSFATRWKRSTLCSGMAEMVKLETELHNSVWVFDRTLSLLQSGQASDAGIPMLNFSDIIQLSNIFSSQLSIPRPTLRTARS